MRRAAKMALGVVVLAGCSEATTTETEAGTADTATSAEVSIGDAATDTRTDTGVTDTGSDSVSMPYGAPPADGLLV